MALDHRAISLPELIVRAADEGLDRFHIHFLDAVHLGDLQNPVSLQFFRCGLISHICDGERIGEPLLTQQSEEGRLAHTLDR
jgi:hypothetical protein